MIYPRKLLLSSANFLSVMPVDFPTANRIPQPGHQVVFLPRANCEPGAPGGIAMVDREGGNFYGWVRQVDIRQVTDRMAQIQPVRGQIVAVSRMFHWAPGGGLCSRGTVTLL